VNSYPEDELRMLPFNAELNINFPMGSTNIQFNFTLKAWKTKKFYMREYVLLSQKKQGGFVKGINIFSVYEQTCFRDQL